MSETPRLKLAANIPRVKLPPIHVRVPEVPFHEESLELVAQEAKRRRAALDAAIGTAEAARQMLDEARTTARWARRTFWISVAILAVSLVLLVR